MTTRRKQRSRSHPGTPFLTTDQAAEYLHLAPKTLEKYRVVGGGPVYRKHGRKVLYRLTDLDAWSDGRQALSTTETSMKGWV